MNIVYDMDHKAATRYFLDYYRERFEGSDLK